MAKSLVGGFQKIPKNKKPWNEVAETKGKKLNKINRKQEKPKLLEITDSQHHAEDSYFEEYDEY